MKEKDLSLMDYSEVEEGKEFDYPSVGVSGIPIFPGSFLSWGKPEELIRDMKIAARKDICLRAKIRLFLRLKRDS